MKKTILAIMAMCLLTLTQCRKNVETMENVVGGETIDVVLNANTGTDKTTISGTTVQWAAGDKIYVVGSTNGYLGVLTATSIGNTVEFSGPILKTTASQTYYFYYCGDNAFTLDANGYYTYSVATQHGSLSGDANSIANKLQLMVGSKNIEGAATYNLGSVTLNSMMAIARLNLKANGTTLSSGVVNLTGSNSSVKINTKTGGYISSNPLTQGTITLNVNSSADDYYVALIPNDQTNSPSAQSLKFTVDDSGLVGMLGSKPVVKNTYYTSSGSTIAVEMVTVETDEWINFNDQAVGVSGLPIWAKKNIGATNGSTAQSWYGDYYAWGETAPYVTLTWTDYQTVATKTWCTHPSHNSSITFDNSVGYRWKNYLDGTQTEWSTDYEWSPTPYDGTTKVLKPAYDAAYQNATPANTWRMPTGGSSGEWQLLKDNTYFQWTTGYNGIDGLNGYIVYKVKDSAHKGYWTYYSGSTWNTKNASGTVQSGYANQQNPFGYTASDPHMFLPTAGGFNETFLYFAGECGYYWSSSLNSGDPSSAWRIYFFSGYVNPQHSSSRSGGIPVRPVQ